VARVGPGLLDPERRSMTPGAAVLAGVHVGGEHPVAVVGALNVSPESFYAGSVWSGLDAVLAAARAMVEAGASIIDVGGRSTAPYRPTDVSEEEERARLVPAVALLARALPVPVSADTERPGVARAALDAGAGIVNDVGGLRDPEMASLVASRRAGVIAMASPDARRPGALRGSRDPVATVRALLAAALERARAAGVAEDSIAVDPGIGFFRGAAQPWHAWDVAVLANLDALRPLGRPVCVGVSRKSFVGAITGRAEPARRLAGSLAAAAAAVLGGAALVRTHDVAETLDAVRVAERLRAGR
jgi:dihydropteroate synthase